MTEVLVKCGFENFVLRILNYKLNPNTFSKKEKKKNLIPTNSST